MKISEVCAKTGLTERAVRLYVDKGLLRKEAQNINGRNCRDYTERDVEILRDVGVLRKAGFTIQEIVEIQNTDILNSHIEKKCSELEEICDTYQQTISALREVKLREGLDWTKLANILYNYSEHENKNIILRWPQEDNLEEFENKISGRKEIFYVLYRTIICLVIMIGVILSIIFCTQYNKTLLTVITLSEVTFHDKWIEDGKMYVCITCNQDSAIGYDIYFQEMRTIQISDVSYYETIICETVVYDTVSIECEMLHGEAKKYDMLKKENMLNLEKILENEAWIFHHCSICRISKGGGKVKAIE